MHDAAGATGHLLAALGPGPGPGRMRLPLSCRLGGAGPPPGLLRRASPQSWPSGLLSGHRDTPPNFEVSMCARSLSGRHAQHDDWVGGGHGPLQMTQTRGHGQGDDARTTALGELNCVPFVSKTDKQKTA